MHEFVAGLLAPAVAAGSQTSDGRSTVNGSMLSRRFGTPSRPWLTHTASTCRIWDRERHRI